jgi:hypothetical protein
MEVLIFASISNSIYISLSLHPPPPIHVFLLIIC